MLFENLLNLNMIKMMHVLQYAIVMDNSVAFFLMEGGEHVKVSLNVNMLCLCSLSL